jgi:hypothetical protein
MTCSLARESLSARQDGALSAGDASALDTHLAGCQGCRVHEKNLAVLVRALRAQATGAAPADVRRRLEAGFGARSGARWGVRRRAGWLVAAAACAVAIAWWVARPRGSIEPGGALEVIRAGASIALGPGQPLIAEDLVRTRAGASARLRLGDHTLVDLGPSSNLRVRGTPLLVRGWAAFEVSPDRGGLRVETPAGDVVVTGTAFEVEVVPFGKEIATMKATTIGIFAGAAIGALALVHVTRGTVTLQSAGATVPLQAGQSGQMITGGAPEATRGSGPAPEERLASQNAALRSGVEALRAQVERKQAQAAALPAPGKVATSNDPRAPLTTDERKLLGAANLKVSAETRQKLATLYEEVNHRAPPSDLDELALARELLSELRYEHTAGDPPRPPVPPTAAKTMDLMSQRNRRIVEEMTRSLPPERAAAVAATIKAVTHVGIKNGKRDPGHVTLEVPPEEGKPLPPPAPEKKNKQ